MFVIECEDHGRMGWIGISSHGFYKMVFSLEEALHLFNLEDARKVCEYTAIVNPVIVQLTEREVY